MTLIDTVNECRQRLQRLHLAQNDWEVAKQLGDIREELEKRRDALGRITTAVALLRSSGIPVAQVDLGSTASKVEVIAEKFSNEQLPSTLKTGSRWPTLLQNLESVVAMLSEKRDEAWREFITTLFTGSPPDQLEASLAKTPFNVKALKDYRPLFERFANLKRTPPATKEQLEQLRACSRELETIKFQRDVPENIRRFFDAAATSSGFELEQLTKPVLDWLRDNQLIGNYIVRKRV